MAQICLLELYHCNCHAAPREFLSRCGRQPTRQLFCVDTGDVGEAALVESAAAAAILEVQPWQNFVYTAQRWP